MTVADAISKLQELTHSQSMQLRVHIQTGPDSYKWAYVKGFELVQLNRSVAVEVTYK